jgi:hypothetical protein
MSRFFFKVDDLYESYIEKNQVILLNLLEKLTKEDTLKTKKVFNQAANKIVVIIKNNTRKPLLFQEILKILAFYYLRNYPTIDKINPGESIVIDMFFDDETTKFKLKFIGRQNITTKFELSAMVFRPLYNQGEF